MKRWDAGELMLAAIAVLFVAITFWILIRAAWQSPEIRDVPVTPTVRVIAVTVLPTFTPAPGATMAVPVATVVPVIDLLPRETSTRQPTSTPTSTPTSLVIPNATPRMVQRG